MPFSPLLDKAVADMLKTCEGLQIYLVSINILSISIPNNQTVPLGYQSEEPITGRGCQVGDRLFVVLFLILRRFILKIKSVGHKCLMPLIHF